MIIRSYTVGELSPYINWIYYLHAWGIKPRFASAAAVHDCPACRMAWLRSFLPEEQIQAEEALRLVADSRALLRSLEGVLQIRACFHLAKAGSEGDDLLLDGLRFPLLRQQHTWPDEPCLCLSDFVRPLTKQGAVDSVGLFATSVSGEPQEEDPYRQLMIQTLSDRLAEAATECLHLYVRKEAWGYAPDESLTIPELLNEHFQGIRPAVGYPSLPDQSIIFVIDQLLHLEEIGIHLTERGAMHPHASTCGLMFAHPASRYFAVGPIDEEQLQDYAHRRQLPKEELRTYLSANLKG